MLCGLRLAACFCSQFRSSMQAVESGTSSLQRKTSLNENSLSFWNISYEDTLCHPMWEYWSLTLTRYRCECENVCVAHEHKRLYEPCQLLTHSHLLQERSCVSPIISSPLPFGFPCFFFHSQPMMICLFFYYHETI